MNKGELVEPIAKRSGLDKRQAQGALNAFVDAVMETSVRFAPGSAIKCTLNTKAGAKKAAPAKKASAPKSASKATTSTKKQ